jgi:hypothetical protein
MAYVQYSACPVVVWMIGIFDGKILDRVGRLTSLLLRNSSQEVHTSNEESLNHQGFSILDTQKK